jgi:hypothetical protein
MGRHAIRTVLIFTVLLMLLGCNSSQDKAPPRITAQGFAIDTTQVGTASKFGHLRVRIECAGRIAQLWIKERSYEVDLASTPERDHFALFGLHKKAKLRTDVTLDFQNYINQKLTQAGDFQFAISVKDASGQTADAILKIHLNKASAAAAPIETVRFQMQREGKGTVAGSSPFGITWKTIDKVKVTIRVNKREGGASKLASFSLADYQGLTSKQQLGEWLAAAKDRDHIEFDTTNDAAKDQVMGINSLGRHYLLRVLSSNTRLSHTGTTVTLNGEYKY